MIKELLPCPFCGGEVRLHLIGAIICAGCHVEVYAPRPLPIAKIWNNRAGAHDPVPIFGDVNEEEARSKAFDDCAVEHSAAKKLFVTACLAIVAGVILLALGSEMHHREQQRQCAPAEVEGAP